MIVEIKISALLKGHFVVDIAKQQGTYNLTTSAHIKNTKVIDNLRSKGVESLLIDTSKTLILDAGDNIIDNNKTSTESVSKSSPIILEITKAKKLFNESKGVFGYRRCPSKEII